MQEARFHTEVHSARVYTQVNTTKKRLPVLERHQQGYSGAIRIISLLHERVEKKIEHNETITFCTRNERIQACIAHSTDRDDDDGCIQDYDTNIMGRFACHNQACSSRGWASKRVAITIRMYPGEQYNARVYYQHCKACDMVSKPRLDDSYAERVAYRLKKWRGVKMEVPEYSGRSKSPHKSELCEGCKHGHCSEM